MYMIRRIYRTKSRNAKRVASLVRKQQDIYEAAGRAKGNVYFNPGTVPGDVDQVVLEWTQETLGSPFMSESPIPKEVFPIGGEVRELIYSQHIEFWELMTPEKMDDV